jgi:putative addiction module killer protein
MIGCQHDREIDGAIMSKTVIVYSDKTGKEPFTNWLNSLKDLQVRRRILARLRRVEQGNYGDCKHIQDGVFELRLFFGPGHRIYFGEDGNTLVVLLCGGDKSIQDKDIQKALLYWKDYKSNA